MSPTLGWSDTVGTQGPQPQALLILVGAEDSVVKGGLKDAPRCLASETMSLSRPTGWL